MISVETFCEFIKPADGPFAVTIQVACTGFIGIEIVIDIGIEPLQVPAALYCPEFFRRR